MNVQEHQRQHAARLEAHRLRIQAELRDERIIAETRQLLSAEEMQRISHDHALPEIRNYWAQREREMQERRAARVRRWEQRMAKSKARREARAAL